MQHIHILMVDDHPIIIEGYENTLMATKKEDQILQIETANDCDTANELLQRASKEKPYDICFFDISLPSSSDGKLTSGEDLAKMTRDIMPNAKVVILTMFNESYRVHNIIKEINPDGFLIKSDMTSSELAEAFQHILTTPPYYSSTVSNFLKKSIDTDIYVDDINRKILHLLSQGIRTITLREHINLSMSAIEKRKKQLKLLLSVEDGKDETLIEEARKKGFL
ncbi:DNA-binding NarL/FixJ family response regulator [Gelidibacter algens]|uniref:DNA-binding NarL/FixJ family response regulator n=1 Tax=Gelidibacter algens TaxID=49280 RepID=A0A1A7R0F5_9FLAO|nr:response regulator [Gelidibacter algens]OBX25008.1 transcriptional regulator [Gelidibacter algens]RAJ19861.1 DNA-binding NarL/FixJ family response regulator [Gelidibacter algens]